MKYQEVIDLVLHGLPRREIGLAVVAEVVSFVFSESIMHVVLSLGIVRTRAVFRVRRSSILQQGTEYAGLFLNVPARWEIPKEDKGYNHLTVLIAAIHRVSFDGSLRRVLRRQNSK